MNDLQLLQEIKTYIEITEYEKYKSKYSVDEIREKMPKIYWEICNKLK